MALTVLARLRTLRQEVLGLNRRNHDFGIALNAPHLVALVDNKRATKEALATLEVPTPQSFTTLRTTNDLQHLADVVSDHTSFVMKPTRGAGGEGIVVIVDRKGSEFIKASGEKLRLQDLQTQAAEILSGAYALSQAYDEVLIEERLEMHPALSPFAFRGVPDVRVLVAYGVPLLAMIRLPTKRSDGRANLHLGGLGVGLDLRTGRAVYAIWNERPLDAHPDTKAPLPKLVVPHWHELLHVAATCFDCIRLGYFGVDLVVDPKRGPCVLELNARPGLGIQLANHVGLRPLLTKLAASPLPAAATAADRVAFGLDLYRHCVATSE